MMLKDIQMTCLSGGHQNATQSSRLRYKAMQMENEWCTEIGIHPVDLVAEVAPTHGIAYNLTITTL